MKNKLILFCLLSINFLSYSNNVNDICLSVKLFGALGNGVNDDYNAIQAAIDSAYVVGTTVCLPEGTYNVGSTLQLKEGVTLQGSGRGSTSTSTPYNGTILRNTGSGVTIRVTGQNTGIRDLVVYDTNNAGAAGGIDVLADGILIESLIISNVLISGFTDGYALKLEASNNGGIAYCSFYDIRIRHAKIGIHIKDTTGSFVNSNSFYHGAVSGGGFDYCLFVQGGNNNIFNATIFEPYTSNIGHIVVEKGEIIGNNIRVEGALQPNTIPLVEFKANTTKSYLTGTYSGGLTKDLGDNAIEFKSQKHLEYTELNNNLFFNSTFYGTTSTEVPYWELSGAGVTVSIEDAAVLDNYNVLKITIPAGVNASLRPHPGYVPKQMETPQYDRINFGAYVKTNQPDVVLTSCKSPTGVVSGLAYGGDNIWTFVGMSSEITRTEPYDPKFLFNNAGNNQAVDVYFTTPTLCFGLPSPNLESKPMNTSGGVFVGTISTNIQDVNVPNDKHLVLEKNANVFVIKNTIQIEKINNETELRFPEGTIITLLFDNSGVVVRNWAYLKLISNYTSTVNSSLTLVSDEYGTWREISRNL